MKRAGPLLLVALAVAALLALLLRRNDAGPDAGVVADGARESAAAPRLAGAPEGRGPSPASTGPKPGADERAEEGSRTEEAGPAIEGVVLDDETGKPVAGARVVAEPPSEPCPREPPGRVFATGPEPVLTDAPAPSVTGADGRFAFTFAATPAFDLFVRRAGYVVGSVCRVAPGTPVTVRLRRGLSIDGVVVRADGTPVPGATLAARPGPGTPLSAGHVEVAESDKEGKFSLTGLLPGTVVLTADHPLHVPTTLEPMEPGVRDLRIVLVPALRVAFRIRTDDGKEPNAPSAAWRTSGLPPREGLQLLQRSTYEERSASMFGVPGAAPAEGFTYEPLRVACDRPDVVFTVKAVGCAPWVSERIELPGEGGDKAIELRLERDPSLGSLTVFVEDRDGKPISYVGERCQVAIGRRDGKQIPAGIVLQAGETLLLPALPGGPYSLVLRSPTHAPGRADVDVVAGRDNEQRIALGPPAKVRVRFTAPEALVVRFRLVFGREVAIPFPEGATTETSGPGDEDEAAQVLKSGADGLVLSGLSAGRHVIEVLSPDLSAPPTPVDLVEGETRDVEIAVSRR